MKTGVLLVNIGSPDAPELKAVRRYLREFLSDPLVVDIHPVFRWLLLNLIILPRRPKTTAASYRAIWSERGSPLLTLSEELRDALADTLGEHFRVELGMRYGNPSIKRALDSLRKDCDHVIAVPLFPQYATAATGSAAREITKHLAHVWNMPAVEIRGAFFDREDVLDAWVEQHQSVLEQSPIDYLLFSFHGLPERHVRKSDGAFSCDRSKPCPDLTEGNRFCYRAQCYNTAHRIATRLGLEEDQFGVAFQSRLGRTPWIKPYTDELLPELYARGVRNLVVSSPSFAVDCLETLEEIGIRTRDAWLELGGEAFSVVPCLNAHPTWVRALAGLVNDDPLRKTQSQHLSRLLLIPRAP